MLVNSKFLIITFLDLIYQQINEELEGPIHAISLHTFTDSEWKDKNETAQDSPDCLGGMKKEDS